MRNLFFINRKRGKLTTSFGFLSNLKLFKSYVFIETTTLAVLLIIGFVIHYFSPHLPWLRYPELNFWLFIIIFFWNLFFFILRLTTKREIFFYLTRYGFIVFLLLSLYTVGGAQSPFVLVLVFPLIVSVVYLNKKETIRVGVITTILYALLIFADKEYYSNQSVLIEHFIRVLLYGLISFYMYRIVTETLYQKYVKEKTVKKFMEIAELNRVKNKFISVNQHQLRGPLTAIRWGINNAIEDASLSSISRRYLIEVLHRVEMLINTLDKMFYTLEIEQVGRKIKKQKINILSIADEASSLFGLKKTARIKNVNLTISFPQEPIFVSGDPKMIRLAIFNILNNAVCYSPNGSVNLKIEKDKDNVRIIVHDTGIGISEEDKLYIFDKFYRGEKATLLEPNGAGIGLFITKKIIEDHRGLISISKPKNVSGTIVTISLPLLQRNQ